MNEFLRARDFLLAHRMDYATAVDGFRWPQLTHFNWALDYFDTLRSGRTALWWVDEAGGERKVSFECMVLRSNQVANQLRSQGLGRGDRLMVMLGNQVALWETVLAAIKLGVVIIPATPQLSREEVRIRLERARPALVVDDPSQVAAANESTDFIPDGLTLAADPLFWYFTSGTTAAPKLVVHTHQSYPVGHLSTMYWIGLQPHDLHWNISSPGWAKHAWSSFFAPWNAGASVFCYHYARFEARAILETLVNYPITSLCAPPTVWRMLIQEDLAAYPVHLKEIVSAGEPLNPEVIAAVERAWGVPIRDGYGQSETTCMIGNSPGQAILPGAMGRPMPGYKVELVDGELCLPLHQKPLGLMQGYWEQEPLGREGYYRTSDMADCTDGTFVYVGRNDDVFKSSDYRISPFEIESALIEHPAVAEAAVVASPDALRLAVPKAYLSLAPGFTAGPELAASLFAFSRQRLSSYQRIRRLEFAELPKTISGKIRRAELRAREVAGAARRPLEFWLEE